MSNTTQDILETVLDKLRVLASTETVVGDPIKVGEMTILPVVKIAVGFAAGGGEGTMEESKGSKGTGGGGGGGASVNPVGFIVLDGEDVRFVNIGKGKLDTLFETVPDLLRKFGLSKKDGKGKKGKVHPTAAGKEGPEKDVENDVD
ncbi:sporulation protein [bacterium]|nr:sporulation protein [bacterium]